MNGQPSTFWRILASFLTRRSTREAERRADELQGRNFQLLNEVADLKQRLAEAIQQERQAYQTMLNVEYQTRYGWMPFPAAPHIPERLPEEERHREADEDEFFRQRAEAAGIVKQGVLSTIFGGEQSAAMYGANQHP